MGCVSKNEITRGVPWLDRGWKQNKKKIYKGCVWACNWAQGVVSAQNKRKNKTGPFGCVVDYAAQWVLGPTWKF